MRFSRMVIEMLWCDECQMESNEVMSHRGLCQQWGPVKAVSVSGQDGYWREGRRAGGATRCAGSDGWGLSKRRTRHEIEWGWRTEKSWPARGWGRRLRHRWRDWESRKNEGQRETNPLSKLLMFAPLSCTMASHLNLHLLRQYLRSVSGKYSSLADRPVKVKMLMYSRRHWKDKNHHYCN